MFSFESWNKKSNQSGFSLIELIIVISLIAFIYVIAFPNFSIQTESRVLGSMRRFMSDVRIAYDTAILDGKHYRFVVELESGKYWLERTEAKDFYLSTPSEEMGLFEASEQEKKLQFEEQFEQYQTLSGETYKDLKTEDDIPPVSPLLKAKKSLEPTEWKKVVSLEWEERRFVDDLIIKDIRVENRAQPVTLEDFGKEAKVFIYIFPSGYIEKTVMHIYYRLDGMEIDSSKKPYTLLIKPNVGEVLLLSGDQDIDFEKSFEEIDIALD